MIKQFTLYGSDGCHLCELAMQICRPLLNDNLTCVDIVTDEQLVEQYGVQIPVLKHSSSDNELFWPFGIEQVEAFIKQWN